MSEELNKELETEVTEEVKEAAPVETMEDYAAELEASYKTLNQRHIEIAEEESGEGEKWARFAQMMEAVIITVDPEKKRLVLSGREVEKEKKEAQKKERMAQFKAGDIVEGTVDSIKPYGAFIKLDDGVDGLLHVSQISTQRIKHPSAVLTEGQTVKVKILSTQEGKLSLSMKVLAEQQADREEHETFDYKETGTVSTGLGDLLKGLKL